MKKFVKVLLYIFLILLIVELGLKIFLIFFEKYSSWEQRSNLFMEDSLLGWRGVPNRKVMVKTFESKFLVETDSLGFRNTIFPKKNKKGKKILMYGDSFLWGYHLNNDDLISSMLSKELNVEVKNYGMVGYGTDQEYLLFNETVEDSSVVVFLFFNNDLDELLRDNIGTKASKPKFILKNDSIILLNYPVDRKIVEQKVVNENKFENFGFLFKITRTLKLSLYKTKIYRVLSSYLQYTSFGKFLYEKNLLEPDLLNPDEDVFNYINWQESIKIYDHLMKRIKKECELRGCKLLVFVIPSEWTYQQDLMKKLEKLEQLYGYNDRYEEVMDSVLNVLRRDKIDYIYPLDEFRKIDTKVKLTKKFDKHFSKEGAKFVKDLLKTKIEESLKVDIY
ncbi:MAG: hypothetical protein ABIN35_01675 [candidate division WOR-3 bacterium]